MVIIAIFYSDPDHPVQPEYLGLVLVAILVALAMRKLNCRMWAAYIAVSGPISWLGLIKAHVHPALALAFVVPLMPASHALAAGDGMSANLGACDLGPREAADANPNVERRPSTSSGASLDSSVSTTVFQTLRRGMSTMIWGSNDEDAPLHQFEAMCKKPVDFGMFFFGLANAGVSFKSVGHVTGAIVVSLCAGKILGIFLFSLLATKLGYGLPNGLTFGDLVAMSALAGIGLTVALFLASEAFVQPELQAQAKMGAVFSVSNVVIAWVIKLLIGSRAAPEEEEQDDVDYRTTIEVIDVQEGLSLGKPKEKEAVLSDVET
jgi:NhaA family Na+:H+ antiporter